MNYGADRTMEPAMSGINSFTASLSPVPTALVEAIATQRSWLSATTKIVFEKLQQRRAMKQLERFSDHDLQDVGFQREWDGSIKPLNP